MIDTKACPRCNGILIEDGWETMNQGKDGEVVIDAFPALICQSGCGYVKKVDEIPEIIAQQGDDRLLLKYSDDTGSILEVRDRVLCPRMNVDSILGRGYWEKYTGNHDIQDLLDEARVSESAEMEEPNLFSFATSELSQDAFLCWLMSWSPRSHRDLNRKLHEAAVDFIDRIFNAHKLPAPTVESIEIKRQFKSLDILAIVNNTYAILIEDKTYTKDHSDQLQRYRDTVKAEYPALTQLPVYFKIGDQSHYHSPNKVGYYPFRRREMLDVLKRGWEKGVNHPIFIDYYRHLNSIEDKVSAFNNKPVSEWDEFAWQGFFMELQKELDGNWGYVPNQTGGFWGFWWPSTTSDQYYLQLEQEKLCVKIVVEVESKRREIRNSQMEMVLRESSEQNLQLKRPAKLGKGKVMTIAHRDDYLQEAADGTVDLAKTLKELNKY
ncbi:PD-(D/E)XK nuclease family protein [Cytobacillus spongiae]|uniref:PD-(D/E)XK nuclease family protein n=1 Tax=Cytobacillus spongiae TaxID=2901381 RepID=UPI001F3712CC|nr:PD-(D/E)XK nuclease family protein [Cytobacillus spongiae]UII55652.1 PD-(D/E)XK nuclease family protein [Cytobacillus spongiae]